MQDIGDLLLLQLDIEGVQHQLSPIHITIRLSCTRMISTSPELLSFMFSGRMRMATVMFDYSYSPPFPIFYIQIQNI